MDTHIAMGISPDISVADFKRELENMHINCYPTLGEIKVYELTVKRKNYFYHLPESLPIKYAFQGLKGDWFLHVAVRPSDSFSNQHSPQCLAAKNHHISYGTNATGSLITNTRKDHTIPNGNNKRMKGFPGIKSLTEVPKTFPCFEKKSKKKKRLDDIDKEFDKSKIFPNVAANECSGLWTPRNEVEAATAELPETVHCFKNRSKEKKRLKEFDGSKEAPNVAAKEYAGLLTPTNEVEHAQLQKPFQKLVLVSRKGVTERGEWLVWIRKLIDEKLLQMLLLKSALVYLHLEIKLSLQPSPVQWRPPTERPQEVISATTHDFSKTQVYALPHFDITTPLRTMASPSPTDLRPGSAVNKLETPSAVGERIMTAANKLRISVTKKRPALSFYRFRGPSKATSAVRISIFDINDIDD